MSTELTDDMTYNAVPGPIGVALGSNVLRLDRLSECSISLHTEGVTRTIVRYTLENGAVFPDDLTLEEAKMALTEAMRVEFLRSLPENAQ